MGRHRKDYVDCEQRESWLPLSCTSLPREVYPFLSDLENLSFKCDNWLKCDLKAATLEVEENLISVISDTLTQELSKIPQDRPSTVKTFTSSIKTQKPTFHKTDNRSSYTRATRTNGQTRGETWKRQVRNWRCSDIHWRASTHRGC